jgi:hypothetical protein
MLSSRSPPWGRRPAKPVGMRDTARFRGLHPARSSWSSDQAACARTAHPACGNRGLPGDRRRRNGPHRIPRFTVCSREQLAWRRQVARLARMHAATMHGNILFPATNIVMFFKETPHGRVRPDRTPDGKPVRTPQAAQPARDQTQKKRATLSDNPLRRLGVPCCRDLKNPLRLY